MVTLNILYQSDNNFSKHMGVSIISLLENNRAAEDIHVIIIDDGISVNVKNDIRNIVENYGRRIQWIDANAIRKDTIASDWPIYEGFRTNTNCYLKYFIFDGMLDESIERVMYIDSDSIVLGPLDDLFTLDMQDKAIGMTRCCLVTESYLKVTGVGTDDLYFNAGMNLFDAKKWRERQYPEKLIDGASKWTFSTTIDQDLLNFVVRGDVIDLGCQYNYQSTHMAFPHQTYLKYYRPFRFYSQEEADAAMNDPRILHLLRFLGERPWNKNSIHPSTEVYCRYLDMTPWKDEEKPPVKNDRLVFKIERLVYRILPRSVFLRLFKRFHNKTTIKSVK